MSSKKAEQLRRPRNMNLLMAPETIKAFNRYFGNKRKRILDRVAFEKRVAKRHVLAKIARKSRQINAKIRRAK